jgi:hypothetical protein
MMIASGVSALEGAMLRGVDSAGKRRGRALWCDSACNQVVVISIVQRPASVFVQHRVWGTEFHLREIENLWRNRAQTNNTGLQVLL